MSSYHFNIPTKAIELVRSEGLGLPELRLFYALYFAQHQINQAKIYDPNEHYTVKIAELRKAALPAEKGTRLLRKAMTNLSKSRLFEILEIDESGRHLTFGVSMLLFVTCQEEPDAYARADMRVLRKCHTVKELDLTMRVYAHHRMQFPMFHIGTDEWGNKSEQRQWMDAARRVSERFRYVLVVGEVHEIFTGQFRHVTIKVRSLKCQWSHRNLYSFDLGSRVTELRVQTH